MGYTTTFTGKFTCTPALNSDQVAYLQAFANTRRMSRNPTAAENLPDPLRVAVGLPIGVEGEYFVGAGGWMGQDKDASVINYNSEPSTQHGLWCKWAPTDDGKFIQWNGIEKFYDYMKWIEYINTNFLKPWGVKLSGDVKWLGEDRLDRGVILTTPHIVALKGNEYTAYKADKRAQRTALKQNKVLRDQTAPYTTNKSRARHKI